MNRFFTAVFSIRYLAVVAVIGPFLGAALMMLFGITNVIEAYMVYFGVEESEGAIESGEAALITLVASLDHFLFATLLMIFGLGLYSLFFSSSQSSDDDDAAKKRPSWNRIKNLGGMDEMLLKVIIMLLSVSFLEFVLRAGMGTLEWPNLVIPLAVLALGLCLRWMGQSAAEEEEAEHRHEAEKSDPARVRAILDQLERLTSLREQGTIDDAEYAEMKAHLLE